MYIGCEQGAQGAKGVAKRQHLVALLGPQIEAVANLHSAKQTCCWAASAISRGRRS